MQIRNAPNSTESNAYELMFGRHIRTFLDHIKPNRLVARKKCEELTTKIRRNFTSRAKVNARNDTKRGPKWRFGEVLPR